MQLPALLNSPLLAAPPPCLQLHSPTATPIRLTLSRRTEEGYAIYSETELGLGKAGGNTNKCPFDCDCCF